MTRLTTFIVLISLCLWPVVVIAQSADLTEAFNKYKDLNAHGRYSDAEPFAKRALELGETEFGSDHEYTGAFLNNLAELYREQGRYAEAEPLYKRSLAINEKVLGPDHANVATNLNNLAKLYKAQGRYADAEPLFKRSLAIDEKALGPDHPYVAATLNNLALLYKTHGRYAEAEALFKRSLAIYEKALGPDHTNVATILNNLALLYKTHGRYAEAEALIKRSLAIDEKALGPDHPDVARDLNNLASLYDFQGHYAKAEPLYKRSLAIKEKALGPDHSNVAATLNNLALLYKTQGRYAEPEALYKRSIAINEKALGPDHPRYANNLSNLAELYYHQGRYVEAEALFKRSLAIMEKALGPDHTNVAIILNNLASLYDFQGRYTNAEPLYKRSLAIDEKALGPDHTNVAITLNNLAGLYHYQGRYAEAEAHYKRSLTIDERALGHDHPRFANSLSNLALLYDFQGHYAKAEPLYKRSLAIKEKALGPDHPNVAITLNNLAGLYNVQARDAEALTFIRRANAIHSDRATQIGVGYSGASLGERKRVRFIFLRHVQLVLKMADIEPGQRPALTAEGFEVVQLARASSTAAAVARMGARFGAGDDTLARLVRNQQDAVNKWQRIDKSLIAVLSRPPNKRNASRESRLHNTLKSLDQRISSLDEQLVRNFPGYAELVKPRPLSLANVQKLLNEDEALISYTVSEEATFLWIVRHNRASMHRLAIRGDELSEAVGLLRKGLDSKGITSLKQVPSFDTTKAYELYKKLFAPAEKLLEGVRHVMVVPDGALQSLPLGVLVTKEPQGSFTDYSGYRQVSWLAKKYALSVLPSVSSLKALRVFAKKGSAKKPFIGFGDPVFKGRKGSQRGSELAGLFSRGSIVNVNELNKLPRLTKTADELRGIAMSLNAGSDSIYLQQRATESQVKTMDLSDVRILAFATHGFLAGKFKGQAEPGLALTPPNKSTEHDDGYLTASEAAQLKLNAEWVILSACNTAGPDGTPGAEGLSGLAKAFFYAGSRTLLVSHWYTESGAAMELTTRMFEEARDKTIGRAEALKRSMMALMNTPDAPYYAHPMFWAPFSVVGEGGR